MKIKLKLFDSNIDKSFFTTTSVFLSRKKIVSLGLNDNDIDEKPIYIKINSNDTLKKFTFYAKLDALNPKSELNENILYVPKELIHKLWVFVDEMKVDIEILNLDDLKPAEVITIRLNNEDVKLWSEEEAEVSKRKYLLKSGITYINQITWLNPSTQSWALGEVVHIYPQPESILQASVITKDTVITLEGLSENKQKVIDFHKIGGLTDIINHLREIIQIPITHPELLSKFHITSPKGMLMYGPPGNGKTMIARAIAQSMGSHFITIDLTDATSKYTGVAEQKLKEKFETAAAKGNCVIFIDEIDSIASKRTDDTPEHQIKIVSSLLSLMDGLNTNSGVFIIGATNRLNAIDSALRRPGRFDLEFEVPLPNQEARLDILHKYIDISDNNLIQEDLNEDFLQIISELTTGYSGADLTLLYRESVMNAIRENVKIDSETGKIELLQDRSKIQVTKHNLTDAIKSIKPTSLRSTDIGQHIISWDKLIAVDKIKQNLIDTHDKLEALYLKDNLCNREASSNIILLGKKGSGKQTLIYSFSKHYNYEVLIIDILDLFSISLSDASKEIENYFIKAKQISPSIILIRNTEKIKDNEFYLFKILNELSKLNNRNKILSIIEFESEEAIPKTIIGYKGFTKVINIKELIDYNILCGENKELKKDFLQNKITIGEYISNNK